MSGARRCWDLAALLVSTAAAAVVLWRARGVGLVGWDTLPEIASSRIQGVGDLLSTFVERTAEGYYPYAFYRPVFNLSLALDYAVWGIDPFGYHLTSVALLAAGGFALYRLARGLLGAGAPAVGPWVALAVFLAGPVHLELVAIVSRRMDLIVGLLGTLALASQLKRCDGPMPRSAVVPALLTLAAVGAKEIAVLLPVLAFLLVLLYASRDSGRLPWRHAGLASLPHFGAVALCLALRFAALGGLGGHPSTRIAGALDLLPAALGREMVALVAPGAGGNLPYVGIGVVTLLGAGLLWGRLLLVPRRAPLDRAGRAHATVAIALAWLVGSAAIFGMIGFVQLWFLLVPLQALALLIGAVAQRLADVFAQASARTARAAAVAGLLAIVAWTVTQFRASPLFRAGTPWIEATRVANAYLAGLREHIEATPAGSVIGHPPPPMMVRVEERDRASGPITALTSYTVQAWADLVYADREVVVLPRNQAAPPLVIGGRTTVVDLNRLHGRRPSPRGEGGEGTLPRADPRRMKQVVEDLARHVAQSKGWRRGGSR